MSPKRRQTFFLEQAEFLGGAERFSLDFFGMLTATEKRLLNLTIVGAEHDKYQALVPNNIAIAPFKFPAVSGNIIQQGFAALRLFWRSKALNKLITKEFTPQWVTNTPRGHFLVFLAKVCWRLPGRWTAIFHDFTTRPPWLLRMIARRADILIANSLPTRQYLRNHLPEVDHSKIRIIENGVNLANVPSNKPPTEIKNIIHIGRIDPRKGQLYTTQAAAQNSRLNFYIVGMSVTQDPRTTAYESEIKALITKHDIDNVHFVGEVDEPFAEISKHDLLLALSTEPETFGRIATEGLACNKLVLAFDQVGPREILNGYHQWLIKQGDLPKNTPNPLIVPANDADALAQTILHFSKNPDAALVYTKRGNEFITKHYALKETKKRLVDILTM